MNGAPSTWRAEDKSKIREHYKRRSLLMTSHSDSVLAMKRNPGAPIGLNSNPHVRRSMSQNDLDTPGPSNRSECSDPQCCNSEGRRRHRASRYNSRDYGIGPSPLSSPPQSKGRWTNLQNWFLRRWTNANRPQKRLPRQVLTIRHVLAPILKIHPPISWKSIDTQNMCHK